MSGDNKWDQASSVKMSKTADAANKLCMACSKWVSHGPSQNMLYFCNLLCLMRQPMLGSKKQERVPEDTDSALFSMVLSSSKMMWVLKMAPGPCTESGKILSLSSSRCHSQCLSKIMPKFSLL